MVSLYENAFYACAHFLFYLSTVIYVHIVSEKANDDKLTLVINLCYSTWDVIFCVFKNNSYKKEIL